jgi:hypothetical protein
MVLALVVAMFLMTLSITLALSKASSGKQCTAEEQQYELFHCFILL